MLPEIKFFGVVIPTYFAWLSLVYSMVLYWVSRRAQADPARIPPVLALDACLWILVWSFVGARLLHVVWESPEMYKDNLFAILMIWNGGFVYYGGLGAGLLSLFVFCRLKQQDFWQVADFLAPMLAVGYGIGRMACFLGGCCFGTYCSLPWAVEGRHPVQIYALVLDVILGLILLQTEKRFSWMKVTARVSSFFLIGHGANRMFIEYYRMDFRGALIAGFSISTWISLLLILVGIALQLKIILKRE
jgi:phosphatidylglycerol:prolipoprotein diacylglycerol transferase